MGESKMLVERVWRSDLLDSTEHFRLLELRDGFGLSGTVMIAYESERVGITYELGVNSGWVTRSAAIQAPDLDLDLDIAVDNSGAWRVNGQHRSDLDDCTDIDLGWTPATNTLPIRRTGATIDQATTIRAGWLRWPQLVFTPANQTYTKRGENTWLYQQGDFSAGLEVDRNGVVITYGDPPIWHQDSRSHRPGVETDSGAGW